MALDWMSSEIFTLAGLIGEVMMQLAYLFYSLTLQIIHSG
jgi:hypothetical protein